MSNKGHFPHAPTSVALERISQVQVSESDHDFAGGVYVFPGKRWRAVLQWKSTPFEVGADLRAHISKLNGREHTFLVTPKEKRRGLGGGNPVVSVANQTGAEIVTDGWPVGTTGVLLPGDFISIDDRLYEITDQVDSDGSGTATLKLWPYVCRVVSVGTDVEIDNPAGEFRSEKKSLAGPVLKEGGVCMPFNIPALSVK